MCNDAHLWTICFKYSFIDCSIFHFQLTFGTLWIEILSLISVCRIIFAYLNFSKRHPETICKRTITSDHSSVHTVQQLFYKTCTERAAIINLFRVQVSVFQMQFLKGNSEGNNWTIIIKKRKKKTVNIPPLKLRHGPSSCLHIHHYIWPKGWKKGLFPITGGILQ